MSDFCSLLNAEKNTLENNSIFLLTEDKDTDFEFYVFVDNHENRHPFLAELHHCLCKLQWDNGVPKCDNGEFFVKGLDHESDLRKWLEPELANGGSNDLITPLNWLKIAIERYPYRLFVVIDKDKWGDEECNPTDNGFWKTRSPFLHKRICWIDKASFNGDLMPAEIKNHLVREWLKHIKTKFIGHEEEINIYIKNDSTSHQDKAFAKTLPIDCFNTTAQNNNTTLDCDTVSNSLIFKEWPRRRNGGMQNSIIFYKHGSVNRLNSFLSDNNTTYNDLFYFEFLSGSQFQLPLLRKDTNILLGAAECTFKIAVFDERYIEWWNSSNRKIEILATRIIPIKKFNSLEIAEQGCTLKSDLSIEIPNSNTYNGIKNLFAKDNNASIYPDILIIHQGVIDKLRADNIPFNISTSKDNIPFVIVTSGRGYPSNLPKGAKFLPFSPLEFFMMKDYPEKLLFLKILMKLWWKEE